MKHENFPVVGFEFMDEPATDEQKRMIVEICNQRNIPIDPNGPWPEPFSKWDAGNMIQTLKGGGEPDKLTYIERSYIEGLKGKIPPGQASPL
jgi:hypothetical protein